MDIEKLRFFRKLVIIAIFSDDDLMEKFVLKGGSAIELIYKIDSRASIDIDLSMKDDFDEYTLKEVERKLQFSLEQTFEENGYTIFDFSMKIRPKTIGDDFHSFWGGYLVEFKIYPLEQKDIITTNLEKARKTAEIIGPSASKKLSIDISKCEYCEEKETAEIDGLTVYVYTPKMIVFEKLRAICQQMAEYPINGGKRKKPRPRDFYDIYTIMKHFNFTMNTDDVGIIEAVFGIKKVDLELLKLIPDYKAFFEEGLESLKATLTSEKNSSFSFNECFDFVLDLTTIILEQQKEKNIAV